MGGTFEIFMFTVQVERAKIAEKCMPHYQQEMKVPTEKREWILTPL
jgi:hypothetical protein